MAKQCGHSANYTQRIKIKFIALKQRVIKNFIVNLAGRYLSEK